MIQVNRYTLANGLRIVHNEDDSTQMVALNLLYDVGARDEDPSHTGFAHLFEHLMFGHQNVETGFWLESDRMLSLDFSPKSLEVQRQVVIEEFKQRNLNQPYGDASHLLRELAYESHPYRWPTIGKEIAHIAQATLEEVKDFFYRFYAPNNAILAVTGHISFEETIRLAEKWFGPIPARNISPRQLPAEKPQTAIRRKTVERKVPVDAIYMAFHMSNRMHPDYYVYDMITDILSNGRSSRFIQSLVQEQKLFTSIDAYISGSLDEGLLHVTGKPVEGVSLEQAEEAIWKELEKMKTVPVSEQELEKVKNRYESEQIFNNINYLNVATNLAFFELTGKAEDINEEVGKYRAVTAEQIQATSARIRLFHETFKLPCTPLAGHSHRHRTDWSHHLRLCRHIDDWASQYA